MGIRLGQISIIHSYGSTKKSSISLDPIFQSSNAPIFLLLQPIIPSFQHSIIPLLTPCSMLYAFPNSNFEIRNCFLSSVICRLLAPWNPCPVESARYSTGAKAIPLGTVALFHWGPLSSALCGLPFELRFLALGTLW